MKSTWQKGGLAGDVAFLAKEKIGFDNSCNQLQHIVMKTKENACQEFGAFVKAARIKQGITARDAAAGSEMLPSNFSKIEHGVLRPPSVGEKQRKMARVIGLISGSQEEARFFDLAARANDATPVDVADIISREEALPLLLRTIGNKRLGKDDIEKLVSLVRGKNAPTQAL